MTTSQFDRRLTPARPDRAAEYLRGTVEATTFVAGERRMVAVPLAPLRREPRSECAFDTEALRGETVTLYEDTIEGWAWVQLERDGYVGYMPSDALGMPETATHRVAALRTLVFPGPDLKLPIVGALSLGGRLAVGRLEGGYAAIAEGFVWAAHLAPVDSAASDFVAVAERFLGVPYLWGGKSSLGLDCSGLLQVALGSAGQDVPRDSDMQERALGIVVPDSESLQRGDLIFWKGHVGIMRDATTLLHANAHAMMVSSEPMADACARIRDRTGADVRAIKRL